MSLEEERNKGTDAKAVLGNQAFNQAFDKVNDYLEAQALGCDPDNKEKAQRIILSKQILQSIKRELTKTVENGNIAVIQIEQLAEESKMKRVVREIKR